MKKLQPNRTEADLVRELAAKRPFVDLLNNPAFQLWVEGAEKSIERIQRAAWNDCSLGELRAALNALGLLDEDGSKPDPLTVFIAARSVVRFWHGMMGNLTQARDKHEELRKQLDARRKERDERKR